MEQLIAQKNTAAALRMVQIVWKLTKYCRSIICTVVGKNEGSVNHEKDNHVYLMQAGQTFTKCAPFHFAEPSSLDVHALL